MQFSKSEESCHNQSFWGWHVKLFLKSFQLLEKEPLVQSFKTESKENVKLVTAIVVVKMSVSSIICLKKWENSKPEIQSTLLSHMMAITSFSLIQGRWRDPFPINMTEFFHFRSILNWNPVLKRIELCSLVLDLLHSTSTWSSFPLLEEHCLFSGCVYIC